MFGILFVIASDGRGWDHVSVSRRDRCPTWEEMEEVRGHFFLDAECAVQFSPPRDSERVNQHPYCLHLWRDQTNEVALPPTILVGVPDRPLSADEQRVVNEKEAQFGIRKPQ